MTIERSALVEHKNLRNPEFAAYHTWLLSLSSEDLESHFFETIDTNQLLQDDGERIRTAHDQMVSAHGKQTRKYTGDPYKVHPQRVALLYVKLNETQKKEISADTFIAAFSHDMIEDGPAKTGEKLRRTSGQAVHRIVEALTRHADDDGNPIGHWEAVKKVRQAHRDGVREAKPLKTLDRTDNLRDQDGVSRPPLRERVLFLTEAYKKSDYGKWKRNRKRTLVSFVPALLLRDRAERDVIFDAIKVSKREIRARGPKTFRK